ncbi:MAG: AraC family transcriptional regulator [Myxococcota bacterium]
MAEPSTLPHGGRGLQVFHEQRTRLPPHPESSHTEHRLTFVVEGTIQLECGGRVRVGGGSLVAIPAGIPHRSLGGRSVEYWLATFCATCLRIDEGQVLMQPFRRVRHGALPVVAVPAKRRRRIVQHFRELRQELELDAPESPELSRSLLLLLLGETTRAMPADASPAAVGSFVGDALGFIQRRALSPISLSDVAAAVHRSPAHVAATVKKDTGYTVGSWIRAARVSEAASRLIHTDESLDEIATRVGWGDKTHFIRQFAKVYGLTPAKWRKANQ